MKMRWINLLSVAMFLTLSVSAFADEGTRIYRPATIQAGPLLQLAAGVPTHYEDYPAEAYPLGFSSYRGTGFMGSCCEGNAPDVACLWKDYCQTKNHHAKLFDGLGHGGKHGCGKPRCLAATGECTACGGSAGLNVGPVPGLPVPPPPANGVLMRPFRAGPTPAPAEAPTPPAPAVESDALPVPPSVPGPPAAETTRLQPPLLNGPRGAAVVVPPPSPQDKTAALAEPRGLRVWTVSY
jgi:hypothetical protein